MNLSYNSEGPTIKLALLAVIIDLFQFVNSSVTSNTINQEIAFFGLFKEQNPFQCPLQTA